MTREEKEKLLDLLLCLGIEVSVVRDLVSSTLQRVEDVNSLLADTNTPKDATEKKLQLWLEMTGSKITGFTYRIPETLHQQFKEKCIDDGYSLQEGVARLIKAYVDGNILVKETED